MVLAYSYMCLYPFHSCAWWMMLIFLFFFHVYSLFFSVKNGFKNVAPATPFHWHSSYSHGGGGRRKTSPPPPNIAMIFSLVPSSPIICFSRPAAAAISTSTSSLSHYQYSLESTFIRRAAEIADKSAGFTAPHPNYGCIVATASGDIAGEGFLFGQGTKSAEVQAVEEAGEYCRGGTAFLNLESSECAGDDIAVSALVQVRQ